LIGNDRVLGLIPARGGKPLIAWTNQNAIHRTFELDCSGVANPYGDGRAAERIIGILARHTAPRGLLRKTFHELAVAP